MPILGKFLHKDSNKGAQHAGAGAPKGHHALHDLKNFVFSPLGLAFTIGLILVVHWFSTKDHKKA